MKHELARLADIPETGTLVVPFFGREVHVWRTADGPRAVASICTHIGGPLECRNGRLVCLWHGATFDMAYGTRIDGPAPRGRLMHLPTRVEDGALLYVWGEPA